jgi:hypothetical protein
MKKPIFVVAIALALGMLAGCDRGDNPQYSGASPSPAASGSASTGSSAAPSSTPNTPANTGTPSKADKAEGSNPTQGQVDPKDPAQHKDFEHKGDSAGPKNPGSPK